jgi:glycyl-tRNA synthetase
VEARWIVAIVVAGVLVAALVGWLVWRATRRGARAAKQVVETRTEDGFSLGGTLPPLLLDPKQTIASWTDAIRPQLLPALAADGTITLVFSDVEDSTSLNVELGDARFHEVIRSHDALARRLARSTRDGWSSPRGTARCWPSSARPRPSGSRWPSSGRSTGTSSGCPSDLPTIVDLCKQRGIIFPTAEIYGGVRSTWDYGPLGVELKENVKRQWWRSMVQLRDDVVGMEQALLGPTAVWEASGHLANFSDPLVECANCHQRFREDHLREEQLGGERAEGELTCPSCGKPTLGDARNFNLMFKTNMGPIESEGSVVWLRPETAQGMFVNFATVQRATRKKPPFGIAQMGKSFRNEITPGNFVFRTREFEQMELEYFVEPGTDEEWHQYWIDERIRWYTDLGIRRENLRIREHEDDELSHYAKRTVDIEYFFPDESMRWSELEGLANRTDFDLKAHQAASGQDLTYFDQQNERALPPLRDRARGRRHPRHPRVPLRRLPRRGGTGRQGRDAVADGAQARPAPVALQGGGAAAVEEGHLTPTAREVFDLVKVRWMCEYDETQSIGRRYRRQDEIGTPFCVTVDFDTLDDRAVTVRNRDTMAQDRVSIDRLVRSRWTGPCPTSTGCSARRGSHASCCVVTNAS